jgi:hypothetical protein
MEKIIACCGLNCASCEARIATITNDDELRKSTAEKWQKLYNSPAIAPESINCTGCRLPGVKLAHCSECQVRNCAIAKGYSTCSECNELTTCSIVAPIHNYSPDALKDLLSMRN